MRIIKKFSIFLLILTLLFSLALPVFAWTTENWFDNVVSDEVVSGAPSTGLASHKKHIILYNTEEQTYYYIVNTGTGYSVSFYVDANTDTFTMTNNNVTTFNVYKYVDGTWTQQTNEEGTKNLTSYVLSNCLYVGSGNGALFYIDNVQLEYENGQLKVDGVEQKKLISIEVTSFPKLQYEVGEDIDLRDGLIVTATYDDGSTADVTADCMLGGGNTDEEGEHTIKVWYGGLTTEFTIVVGEVADIDNNGLLSGLTNFFEDFFNGLFEGILSVVDFVITVLKKLGDLLLSLVALIQAIPLFLEGLIELISPEGPLVSTMKNFFGQNTYANSIFVMLLAFLGYGVFKSVKSLVKDGTDWS